MSEIDQVKMQGIDKNFYNKIIPVIQKQIFLAKHFLFPFDYNVGNYNYQLKIDHVTQRGKSIKNKRFNLAIEPKPDVKTCFAILGQDIFYSQGHLEEKIFSRISFDKESNDFKII